jgi:N-acetyl-gamma-glutamylphosphate reductase
LQVFVKPQLLATSRDVKGGAISFDRLRFNARNTLRQKPDAILSTFLDLYALDTTFPAFKEAQGKPDVHARVLCLEDALHEDIVEHVALSSMLVVDLSVFFRISNRMSMRVCYFLMWQP